MATPLSEIATEQLIYEDVTQWSVEEFMAEQERCQEVIDLHAEDPDDDPGGVINEEYTNRVNHIEEMRRMAFPRRDPSVHGTGMLDPWLRGER